MKTKKQENVPRTVRCAIYTRKSTEEGLEQEFNSLDAQREAAQAFIASQRREGWLGLPGRYDDGGYSGANIDRPALQQLLADIREARIDCVVVYKVDRLSRSLLDFARLMELFQQHDVSFVSVTQQFNTATSMGRLVLNVLLSFAQFEREMISERTRDKIAATRRKGKWTGGFPPLGYDVVQGKLVVNPQEAQRVREIFALYLEHQSLSITVRELLGRGWTTKGWTTRKGQPRGGRPFTKNCLLGLLTNVVCIGQVKHKDEAYPGEHQAILEGDLFRQVQRALVRGACRSRSRGRGRNSGAPALLRRLLHCATCDCPMVYRYAQKESRRYGYYVCRRAVQCGWKACPFPSLPAGEVERFVLERIKGLGDSPHVLRQALAAAAQDVSREDATVSALSGGETRALEGSSLDEHQLQEVWSRLSAHLDTLERGDLWQCIDGFVERVVHDGPCQRISIAFRAKGLRTLIHQLTQPSR